MEQVRRLESTKELAREVNSITGIPVIELITTKQACCPLARKRTDVAVDILSGLKARRGCQEFYRESDRYWNATEMAKAYSEATGTRKDVGDWLRLGTAESLLAMVSENTGIPVFNLTEVIQGRSGGTWIHPLLVHAFTRSHSGIFRMLASALI